ncbi:MAG: TRAP transporter permease [Thermodesulfobacteriota bacterium]|nr:TRAP transporter permease [Thermodesulfobacteriota bacterium]
MRELTGITGKIVLVIAAVTSLFHLYTGATGVLEPRLQRGFHLLFLVPLAFLLFPMTRRSPRDRIPWYDWILAGLAAVPSLYVILDNPSLTARWEGITPVTPWQMLIGGIVLVTLVEAVRRSTAAALAILMVIAFLYAAFGHHLPGIFYHREFSLERLMEISYLLDDEGIYGSITGVSAVFVALFVIFGAFIHWVGLGQYFMDLACRVAGKTVGGPAKVAVISSAFFGTISGAAAANVYATGTFSIPLMKRMGYRPQFAGAVEAAASTGGQIMPPIMGAAAFLMAQITQIPYISICKAAFPAAILFFLCVGATVHYEALKYKLGSMEEVEAPSLLHLFYNSYLLLPVIALLALMIIGYSPFMGAFVGTIVSVGISIFDRARWMTPAKILKALEMGGRNMVMIACACAGAGLIISVVLTTGFGLRISNMIIAYSGGYYLTALFFIMVSAIILGMGLPTTAAYVLAISVGGPTLIEMGGDVLSVHLFVFFFAVMACVTPPVALAAYAGAALAGTNPIRTGFEASRIAAAGYIIPYLFVFNPGILLRGNIWEVSLAMMTAVIGIYLLVWGLEGWMLIRLNPFERLVLLLGAIFVPFPIFLDNFQSVIIGLSLMAILYLIQRRRRRNILIAQAGGPS